MLFKTNKYQTELSEELKNSLPQEVWDDMLDYIEHVPFINWLISDEKVRGLAKDRPKKTYINDNNEVVEYDDGRIIVDITKPHILENMDYFRQPAINFKKFGRYTNITPNKNKKSAFGLFWQEEVYKWQYGLVRPSDGEWIPGYFYFYLNYSPIFRNKAASNTIGKKKADRIYDFPDVFLGDYLWFHYIEQATDNGQHVKLLKARGCGGSYKMSGMGACNMFIYPGLPNFYLASDKTFLEDDKGIFGKVIKTLDWIGTNCPLPKLRLVDQPLVIKLGYTDEYGAEKGMLSSVFGISLMNQPNKARGIRGKLILYEEDGLFPNLETAWNVNRDAVEDGDLTFGMMAGIGTGGVSGASFEASERLFYKPDAYNVYGIPNVFDKGSDGSTNVGFFWGSYMNRAECYDVATGEPDVIKSMIKVLLERSKIKFNSEIAGTLSQRMAEQPLVPQEAVMRTSSNIFPTVDIKYTIGKLMVSESYHSSHIVGDFLLKPGSQLEFKENYSKQPIRKYPTPNGQKFGAIELFEQPINGNEGKPAFGRYILAADPIDFDSNTYTDSLGSIFVFDTFKDCIVAEYTGRPQLAEEFYEICRLLAMYYNGQINYGNKTRGMYPYFRNKNSLHYLCDVPQILFDKELTKTSTFGNNSKGTIESPGVISFGNGLIREWLLSESFYQEFDDDQESKTKFLNVHKIRSKALLEELAVYDDVGNFDRVAALRLLMILRAQVLPQTNSLSTKNKSNANHDKTFNDYWKKIEGRTNLSYTDEVSKIFGNGYEPI